MRVRFDIRTWGLLAGWLAVEHSKFNCVLFGPFEFLWGDQPYETSGQAKRLQWFWSPSRVWLLDIGQGKGLSNAYGLRVSFDFEDARDRSVILQLMDYVIALRWLPAQLELNRMTMREQKRAAVADQFTQLLHELLNHASPPDLRSNPNLN